MNEASYFQGSGANLRNIRYDLNSEMYDPTQGNSNTYGSYIPEYSWGNDSSYKKTDSVFYMFKRKPGFFDMIKYRGVGAFAHGGGAFPATIGRIQHGFDSRPDLCAIDNNVNPVDYLGKFWIDSLVHDIDVLEFLMNKIGNKKIAMGSDYPFPLGETEPGSLIKNSNFSNEIKENLLYKNALDWLSLKNTFFE